MVVSGEHYGGVPRRILDAWLGGRFELVVSRAILDEYARIYDRMKPRSPLARGPSVLQEIPRRCEPVRVPSGPSVTADPDDDKFMWAAWTADAVVVSGDRDLLDASGWRGVRVLTPRDFLTELDPIPG